MYNLNFRQRNQLYILKFPISVSVVISASYVRQYVAISDYMWLYVTIRNNSSCDYWLCTCDYMWLCVTVCDYVRLCVTMSDYVRLYVTMCDYVWLNVTISDYMWLYVTLRNNSQSDYNGYATKWDNIQIHDLIAHGSLTAHKTSNT